MLHHVGVEVAPARHRALGRLLGAARLRAQVSRPPTLAAVHLARTRRAPRSTCCRPRARPCRQRGHVAVVVPDFEAACRGARGGRLRGRAPRRALGAPRARQGEPPRAGTCRADGGPATSRVTCPELSPPSGGLRCAGALPGRAIHPRGAGPPRPALHQSGPPGVRPGQPAGDRQGGAFCPLFAVFRDRAAPLPGGVRRRRAGRRAALRRGGGRARREAVRAGLPRLRRRLDRPGRRRPHRLRVGLQHPHQGRCSAAASPPTSSSRPATSPTTSRCPRTPAAATATTATSGSGPSSAPRWTRSSRSTRARSSGSRPGRPSAGRAATTNRRGPGSARSAPRRSTCCAACCRRRP